MIPVAPPTPAAPYVALTVQGGSTHFLGENVLVDYCLENPTRSAVVLQLGGDYRFGTRSHRFKVTMTDANGGAQADPDPEEFDMGGLGWGANVAPGGRWCQSLALHTYRRAAGPGTYTVRATHDLGWPKGTAPTGVTSVTFREPTEVEAEAVVAKMEAGPRYAAVSAGQTRAPYLDYSALAYAPYLVPLVRRVKAGNAEPLEGIGQIPNLEATRALIALLDDPHSDVAKAAAQRLSLRLPDPALRGALGPRNPFENPISAQRQYLVSVGWSPHFADPVRAAALKLLAKNDDDSAKSGAFFLEAVGTPADNTALVDAFTRAIDRTLTTPREAGVAPTPRGACMELGRAAKMLVARGAAPADPPVTTGDLAESLLAKPSDAILHRALTHATPYVRRLGLEALGDTISPALVADVATNLAGSDPDVLAAAAQVVYRAKLTTLGPSTAAILARTDDSWVMHSAWSAALFVGAGGAAADALASRLTDATNGAEFLRQLLYVFDTNGLHSSNDLTPAEAKALVPIWKKVIAAHRAAIDKNQKLDFDDPSIPRNLVPEGWVVSRPGKPTWP